MLETSNGRSKNENTTFEYTLIQKVLRKKYKTIFMHFFNFLTDSIVISHFCLLKHSHS